MHIGYWYLKLKSSANIKHFKYRMNTMHIIYFQGTWRMGHFEISMYMDERMSY